MTTEMMLLILVIVAGAYMAWNIGANDVANAMGTSVGSGALTLKQAVIIAAVLEFSGAFFFGSHVSETIQKGIVDAGIFTNPMIVVYGMLSALLSAGIWLQIASYYGWPVSTTHSIVGALVGFGAAVGGIEAVYWGNVAFIATSWVISPLLGGLFSYAIFVFLRQQIFYTHNPVEAAKKLTPPLVFTVVFTLCFIMLYKDLDNGEVQFSTLQAVGYSAIAGTIGLIVSLFCLRRIKPSLSKHKSQAEYHPEVSSQLEKAKRHLIQVQAASKDVIQYQVTELLEEIDMLSESLKEKKRPVGKVRNMLWSKKSSAISKL